MHFFPTITLLIHHSITTTIQLPYVRSIEQTMKEYIGELVHLFVSVFIYNLSNFIVIPAITDITMSAICPGTDQCSLAIYLSGFQQTVS